MQHDEIMMVTKNNKRNPLRFRHDFMYHQSSGEASSLCFQR